MPLFLSQVLLMALIAVPLGGRGGGEGELDGARALVAGGLFLLGTLLFAWVFRHNPIGNFHPTPQVRLSGRLITTGPYRHVRHPMYLALLLTMGGVLVLQARLANDLVFLGLCGVLYLKSRMEERNLLQAYPDYRAYMTTTRMIVPFLL